VACLFRTKLSDELGKCNLCIGQRWGLRGKVGGDCVQKVWWLIDKIVEGIAYVRGLSLDTSMWKLFVVRFAPFRDAAGTCKVELKSIELTYPLAIIIRTLFIISF